CAPASLSVKYQCPDGGWRLKPDTSPTTQTRAKASSSSALTSRVNSLMDRTFAPGGNEGALIACSDCCAMLFIHPHEDNGCFLLILQVQQRVGGALGLQLAPFGFVQ